jgi:hypothetical protein
MWLFNNPPRKLLKNKYGFAPNDAWLKHLQRSSIRFNNGGSGSFVSSRGLVLTNHHVGAGLIEDLSTQGKNYVASGFYAKTPAEELPCHSLELNVLINIQDVSERISAAVKPGSSLAEAERARRAAMNTIEQEALERTGLRSDVVTLYEGGLYHLYQFKKYTDVRLVFAPEQAAAAFGGDPDNFEYPRFDLDICFFRVYENGKPAAVRDYLRWSSTGARDGELVLVSGHPGKTDRQDTVAHLKYTRDVSEPYSLAQCFRKEVLFSTFGQRSAENARRAQEPLLGVQNGRKALLGRLAGLQDPAVMASKQAEEFALRQAVSRDEKLLAACGTAWDEVAAAQVTAKKIHKKLSLLEHGSAFASHRFGIARTLVRMATESAKPNAQRLREYRKSNRQSLEQALFSDAPIYDDLETVTLADSLSLLMEQMGADDALVQKVLAGKSPRDRAAELIAGTRLSDVAVRRQLAAGGLAAVRAAHDPMIELAWLVDEPARAVRRIHEEQVEEPLRQAYAKIAKARFAVEGTGVYPDATFTLRLSFGVVKGYTELGKPVAPWTTLGGAFRRAEEHNDCAPFALPPRWLGRKSRLDLDTPFNFVATADIIGGNSGSPVVNRRGEFVGIIFDGNLQSLVWDFIYTEKEGRAVAVHAAAIEEALRKLYDAQALADELGK